MGDQATKLSVGNQTITLDVGGQTTKLAIGNQTTKLDLGAASTQAMQSITLTVGASSIKVDQMGVTIQGMMIKINGEMMTQIQAGILLTAKGAITMIN
jgi:type VI secretion system secreted protein VgrG